MSVRFSIRFKGHRDPYRADICINSPHIVYYKPMANPERGAIGEAWDNNKKWVAVVAIASLGLLII